jgi:hypothetical protein
LAYFLGAGGISPNFLRIFSTALKGDLSVPAFQASKYGHGKRTPRRTHQMFDSGGVGQEIPK